MKLTGAQNLLEIDLENCKLPFHFSGYGDDIPDSEDDQYDYGAEEEYSETTPAPKEGETDDNNIYKDMKRAR